MFQTTALWICGTVIHESCKLNIARIEKHHW